MTTFTANDKVLILACEYDPRAKGHTGRIVDEIPPLPGGLTNGRWTVTSIAWWIAPVLCHPHELRRA